MSAKRGISKIRYAGLGRHAALKLNIHFHCLFVDGVYLARDKGTSPFRCVKAPDRSELEVLVQRQGLLVGDAEGAWLNLEAPADNDAMDQLIGSSVTYRITGGAQADFQENRLDLRTLRWAVQRYSPRRTNSGKRPD